MKKIDVPLKKPSCASSGTSPSWQPQKEIFSHGICFLFSDVSYLNCGRTKKAFRKQNHGLKKSDAWMMNGKV